MRKLTVFNQQSIDGFFATLDGDVSWAHPQVVDAEFDAFSAERAGSDSTLVFGRRTYEMMASFWPTPRGRQFSPVLAAHMTRLPKLVFSRTLHTAGWANTTILAGELIAEVRALKRGDGNDLVILGSGSLVGPLVAAGLVDELGIMVIPIVLGAGHSMFGDVAAPRALRRTATRAFANGRVYSSYAAGA